MKKINWMWYPGDFEIYHGMLQNFSREERGFSWPAYWKMDNCHRLALFTRTYELTEPAEFTVYAHCQGYVEINNREKFRFGEKIRREAGTHKFRILAGSTDSLPAIYIDGDVICSDKGWTVSDTASDPVPVGTSPLYTRKEQNPAVVDYTETVYLPKSVKSVEGGVLYDFERAITGTLRLKFHGRTEPVTLCYGESETEAMDIDMCYYKQEGVNESSDVLKRAFRYIYIPDVKLREVTLEAVHQYIPFEIKGKFTCEDKEINKIWEVATETFALCSGLFFIDGIKRDRWIWSGDAYQSYLINQYLFFDEEINKRTLLALRGNDPVTQHMNTIVDYSLLWIAGIEAHYLATKDDEFLSLIYPKMISLLEYCREQTDELGFIYGRKYDWIFVDWADIDKEGTVCAEQILLARAYESAVFCGNVMGEDVSEYEACAAVLRNRINEYFWDKEKGAYIDSYASGKRHVSRHANIFAILFDLANAEQTEQIIKNVLFNDEVAAITTPYFKFYELEALSKTGYHDKVLHIIKEYWGSMLKMGAVTFWEEYNPNQTLTENYGMYGDPFGKSLCHAWGASPIYLIGRYFMGLMPTTAGYETFRIKPDLTLFKDMYCELPVKDGKVLIVYKNGTLSVTSDRDGGMVILGDKEYTLKANEALEIQI